jgi:hypothetical protein
VGEKTMLCKVSCGSPTQGRGEAKRRTVFGLKRTPWISNVSGEVADSPRYGSAAVAATRARASYASHTDDDSPSSEVNWSSYDEFTDLR